MKLLVKILAGLLIVLYPVCIYYGLVNGYSIKHIGFFAVGIITIRFLGHLFADRSKIKEFLPFFFVCLISLLPAIIFEKPEYLKSLPVIINLNFLILFLITLKTPPTMIERFARLKETSLPDQAIEYCRKVTIVWCCFFIINGAVALWTVFQSDKVWALYNGFVSYLLMGILFLVEFLIRLKVKRNYGGTKAELNDI